MRNHWPLHDQATPVVAWRIALVLIGIVAEGWNVKNMLESGERASEHFGYFTVQSNVLVLVVMVWMLLVRQEHRPRWFEALRGAATAYIVLTGLVYAVLLAQPHEVWSWSIEFTNAAQHRIVPWMAGLDWLFVAPATRVRFLQAAWWMLYPLAYLGFSWFRGGLVDGWYPYPFLDPGEHGGWAGLVWPTGQVLLAFVVGIAVVSAVGAWRSRGAPSTRASIASSTSSSPTSNSSA